MKKLGIVPGIPVELIDAPAAYLSWLGEDITAQLAKKGQPAFFVHVFATEKKALDQQVRALLKRKQPPSVIWISWYKRSAGMSTDITEDVLREIVLPLGWVDIKVCAVSEQWSGLKFVRRKTT